MTGRNDPCPCESGKKYKKCCLKLSHALKSTATRISGEEGVTNAISTIVNKTFVLIKSNECNKGIDFTLSDFQLLANMASGLWNLSLLSSQRVREVLGYIEDEVYRSDAKSIVNNMKQHSSHTPLMIVDAVAKDFDGNKYPISLETYKADVDYIEDNISETISDIVETIEFMIKHSLRGKKQAKEVA